MWKKALPFVGMVMAECAQVGLIILSKQVMSKGMNNFIFIFYSNILAALIVLPASLLIHRSERPALTFSTICGFFLLALLGYMAQVFGYAGIYYGSATLSTSMLNLTPGFTFVLAVVFRMEILDWRSSSSLAKSLGTVVSIAGAFIVTLYKGPALLMIPSSSNLSHQQLMLQQPNWVLGGFFLAADCVMSSAFLIVQASILKKYSAELIVVFYYFFFVAIQSAVTCLVVERDLSAWSLEPKLRLIVILYSGVFGYALQVGLSTWCLHQTGPVFVSMFKPLGIVISVVIGVVFLGDAFYVGSLVGATVIVIGFYSVMWGKAKEVDNAGRSVEPIGQKTPLLQSSSEET
ncbi:WAT1-related protein [Quillaja saponaria]|uniref:WAT1-related protein n=1 Tax=Quillaja saponaria TaxID=32244 RepID=A0AAD7KQT8_QUISA|nr:WAT1-related protein [Quillaja saponaria]